MIENPQDIAWVWVRMLGDGEMHGKEPHEWGPGEGNWRPDIPEMTRWQFYHSFVDDISKLPRVAPAHTNMRIGVLKADVTALTAAGYIIPEVEVAERDRLMSDLIWFCAGDVAGRAEAFFDMIPDIATADSERRATLKAVLDQAFYRGLAADKADGIRVKYNLPLGGAGLEDLR